MTAPYFHRGTADGRVAQDSGANPFETEVRTETSNGTAISTYRRTDYFRDVPLLDGGVISARIYMPAVMVGTDGKVNP